MKNKKEFIYYYGLHAVQAIFEKRKNSIQKIYLKKELVEKLSYILKWCSNYKKPYNIVEDKDLEKLTDSTHHEGVCFVASPKDDLSEEDFFKIISSREKSLILYLNHIENPHNLGAIARTCAHFNISFILTDTKVTLSPSCCRIAQGGVESIQIVRLSSPKQTIEQLKQKGFIFYATSSHEGTDLHKLKFSKKSVLVMGSETYGVEKKLLPLLDTTVSIAGSGNVESLNVSQATALCCYEYFRQLGL